MTPAPPSGPAEPIATVVATEQANHLVWGRPGWAWPMVTGLALGAVACAVLAWAASSEASLAPVMFAATGGVCLVSGWRLWASAQRERTEPLLESCAEGLVIRMWPYPQFCVLWQDLTVTSTDGPKPRLLLGVGPAADLKAYDATWALRLSRYRAKLYLKEGTQIRIAAGRLACPPAEAAHRLRQVQRSADLQALMPRVDQSLERDG